MTAVAAVDEVDDLSREENRKKMAKVMQCTRILLR